MLKGSCLCGQITYQYDGVIDEISMCHCRQCQRAQGSAFAAVAPIRSSAFTITTGQQQLAEFRASANKARVFCRLCGSPLYSARDDLPAIKRLRLGTLDTPVTAKTQYHAFVSSKASWFSISDELPQFERFKPS
ncbi:GFA family protein [Vreelandella olivaria]|uniref:GFA family protein n=1 Tax=Vreelandella olivaria TaxID=390919 RepID=UPI00201F8088|nr:GFA family protein [Halomonas olivaria]